MNSWQVIGKIAKGVGMTVKTVAEGTATVGTAVSELPQNVRDAMPVTEITSVFNTTDKIIKFVNKETLRDTKEILAQSAVSLKSSKTEGAWIPWFDPPRFNDFNHRRLEVVVDEVPVIYIWQRGDHIYWTNRLDSRGYPAKAYKIAGVSHVGGTRMMVIRNDPENGYSAFLSENVE